MESLTAGSNSEPELDVTDVLAVILSVLAPGIGHVILGQVLKGILILTLVIASCGVGYLVSAVIALDAFMVARARRRREVGPWEFFPDHRSVVRF